MMKKLNNIFSTISLVLLTGVAFSQVPIPVGPQSGPILLTGATVHVGDGNVIENGVVGFDNGKITIVGDQNAASGASGYTSMDVSGQHIYPGFILMNSTVGLQEVSSVRAMSDNSEQGPINPNVRSLVAYNTDSEFPATFRFNGVLLAESTPSGGIVSGTSSVMEMEGWNWEDAVHTPDASVHLNWPGRMNRRFDFETFTVKTEPNKNYDKTVDELEMHFKDAVSYSQLASKTSNLKMDAMVGLFDGSKSLSIHASGPKEIVDGVKFAQNHGVQRIVVVTGDGAWHVREFLKENNIPVVLPPTHRTPSRSDYDYDQPYKLATMLHDSGVTVIMSHSGMLAGARNLPFQAGTAVAHGMDKEVALMAITLNPAKALGIDSRVGSLAVGKDATLFVSRGDALDMKSNDLTYAFISGKNVTLDNKQQELFKRFSDKYGHGQ